MAKHTSKQEETIKKLDREPDIQSDKKIRSKGTRNYLDVFEVWEKAGKPQILMVMTGRGTGKTTSAAVGIADYCVKNKKQFILLSRDAFKQVKRKAWFHNAVVRGFTPYDVECEGNTFMVGDQVIGYNYSLHAYNDYRSIEFPEVDFIIFEEFIEMEIDNYWHDNGISEAQFLSDLVSTVFRDRSDGACILLGNNMNEDSKYNPYFEAFGVDFDEMDIKIGDLVKIPYKGKLSVCLYYGGMGRRSEDLDDVKGWAAWMPLNDVALTGEFAPNPLILSNFMTEHSIDTRELQPQLTGLALCTQGIVEYITYYDLGQEEVHIVSRKASGNTDYEPYRIRSRAQAQRFDANHMSKMLYETSKDYATIRKALDPSLIGIRETQRNQKNYDALMEIDSGCYLQDIKIRRYGEFDRWSWNMMQRVRSEQEYLDRVREQLGDVNPEWLRLALNRYRNLIGYEGLTKL